MAFFFLAQLAEDVDVRFVTAFIATGQTKIGKDADRLDGVRCVPQCMPIVAAREVQPRAVFTACPV